MNACVILIAKKTKGNFAFCFHSFLQVFERVFLQKTSHINEKEWPIKVGKISEPNKIYIGNKLRNISILLM